MKRAPIYLAIVDDNCAYRYLIRQQITGFTDLSVCIEASNGLELITQIERSQTMPDICILDIGMPVMDGYETLKILHEKWPKIKVLVSMQYNHKYSVSRMIELGAKGFVSKQEISERIMEAIIKLKTEGHYYSNYVTREVFLEIEKAAENTPDFTLVEKIILSLLCKDLQYNEIAKLLYRSPHTIEKHKQNISRKTGITSREGLILFAIKSELINLNEV